MDFFLSLLRFHENELGRVLVANSAGLVEAKRRLAGVKSQMRGPDVRRWCSKPRSADPEGPGSPLRYVNVIPGQHMWMRLDDIKYEGGLFQLLSLEYLNDPWGHLKKGLTGQISSTKGIPAPLKAFPLRQLPTSQRRTFTEWNTRGGVKADIYKWPSSLHTGSKLFLWRWPWRRTTLAWRSPLYRFSLEYLSCCVWVLHERPLYIPVLPNRQQKGVLHKPLGVCVQQNIEENCLAELEIRFFV